jgi:hypothetical protein
MDTLPNITINICAKKIQTVPKTEATGRYIYLLELKSNILSVFRSAIRLRAMSQNVLDPLSYKTHMSHKFNETFLGQPSLARSRDGCHDEAPRCGCKNELRRRCLKLPACGRRRPPIPGIN